MSGEDREAFIPRDPGSGDDHLFSQVPPTETGYELLGSPYDHATDVGRVGRPSLLERAAWLVLTGWSVSAAAALAGATRVGVAGLLVFGGLGFLVSAAVICERR